MSKHTPGPWEVGFYLTTEAFRAIMEHRAVMRPDGALLCVTGPSGDADSDADARLMAASPKLLEALKGLVACSHGEGVECVHYKRAHAAIAKAEGES